MIIHSLALPRIQASQYDARIEGAAKGAQIPKSTFIKHSTLPVTYTIKPSLIYYNFSLSIFLAKTLTSTLIKLQPVQIMFSCQSTPVYSTPEFSSVELRKSLYVYSRGFMLKLLKLDKI